MALKLVRKKKVKPAATGGRKKKSEIAKFKDAIEVQLRLADGEQVKKGRGLAKSWVEDGEAYGVEMVLVPRVGNHRLYPKSAIVIDGKQKKPPAKELKDLLAQVDDGKLTNRIYAALRQKKSAAAKGS